MESQQELMIFPGQLPLFEMAFSESEHQRNRKLFNSQNFYKCKQKDYKDLKILIIFLDTVEAL